MIRTALVIVPTYNERENVERLLPAILRQDPRLDILVVDDASPDGTGEVVRSLAEGESRIDLISRPSKMGLASAYLDGFRWGLERGYDALFEMDADFSHDPGNLPAFLDAIEGADVVLGSRYLSGRVTVVNWPMGRLMLSYGANMYARWITGLPVADATGGFKCFRREVLEAIDFSDVESSGYAFQIEMTFRAWRRGFRIAEIPITFVDRDVGESKMSKAVVREAVWRVWKLRALSIAGRI